MSSSLTRSDAGERPYDIVIVGGGFSGVMVAINAAQRALTPLRIAIIERKDEVGRGVAFAGTPRDAVLNVPAGSMGAFPDQPDDFVNWLRSLSPKYALEIDPSAYYPRELYGAYLGSLLSDALRAGHDITCIAANIVNFARSEQNTTLIAQDGREVAVGRRIVLALGGPPPADIVEGMGDIRDHPRYVRDPWVFLKRQNFDAHGDILIVGSGLTSLDVIAAFVKAGHSNRVIVVSRTGRFPLPHAPTGGSPVSPIPAGGKPATIRGIVALVRAELDRALAEERDWRTVIDGLRPEVQVLWLGLDIRERRRFLRHVRAIYDPHRHRAPPALLEKKDALAAAGRLRSIAGRVVELQAVPDAIEVTVLRRHDQARLKISAAQIINCGGPANTYSASTEPLITKLLQQGRAALEPSGLGLQALQNGRLLDSRGVPQKDLFTIGWPMRGVLLETTAVRELRAQARLLADTLIASLPAETSSV